MAPRNIVERRDQWIDNALNQETLRKMRDRGFSLNCRGQTGTVSYIHDMSSPSYTWLLPGWLVEERVVPSGRVYKYYYDPAGQQYKKKYQVLYEWERLGFVVLDH